jgi:hypothetical protein
MGNHLNANGFVCPENWRRHGPPPSEHEIETAMAYLSLLKPASKPTLSSYGLKHSAECWGGLNGRCGYVSNGALIAAAIRLNLAIKPDGINAMVGVSSRDVRELDRVMGYYGWLKIESAQWRRWRSKTRTSLPWFLLPMEEW